MLLNYVFLFFYTSMSILWFLSILVFFSLLLSPSKFPFTVSSLEFRVGPNARRLPTMRRYSIGSAARVGFPLSWMAQLSCCRRHEACGAVVGGNFWILSWNRSRALFLLRPPAVALAGTRVQERLHGLVGGKNTAQGKANWVLLCGPEKII